MHDRFLRACRRQPVDATPVWFMRQAGRYMPEYRRLREKHTMLELCKTPELAAEITRQPLVHGVDAAILFADILLPLEPMGASFEFAKGEGPVIHEPITSRGQIDRLRVIEPEEGLGYVLRAIELLKGGDLKVPLIGFAGAPFTLASYLVEGGKSANFAKTKKLMFGAPADFKALMEKLAEVVRRYLRAQIAAGADAVQLFDSWVGDLAPEDYIEHVQPHVRHILADVATTGVPVIHFGVGTATLLEAMRDAGGSVIGVDWCTPLAQAWARVGYDRAVQGNMDSCALLATREVAVKHAQRVLDAAAGRPGHVFNLGHGITPETPVDNVKAVTDYVHEAKRAMKPALVLVSHGTVDHLDDLAAFVTNVRRGHPPGAELVAELRRRYEAIGGLSPLNAVSGRLAEKLGARLDVRAAWANRLWRPYVRDVLAELARDGVDRVAVVPLAQHSAHVYAEDAQRSAEAAGVAVACAPGWGQTPALHEAFARRIQRVLGEDPAGTTVVLTAHSLPRVVIERGDPYEREVRASASAVSERLGPGVRTTVVFQSQGFGAPGEWLGPILRTAIDEAAARGDARVVFAPIGFLADHVEILYDLDIEAASMARERGLAWARAPSLNDDDDLVEILAAVARPLLAELGHG